MLVVAVGLVAMAIIRARQGKSRWWLGALAGLLGGVALCLLAQQFAIVAFTPLALAAFLGGGHRGRRRSNRSRRVDSQRPDGFANAATADTLAIGGNAATVPPPSASPPPPAQRRHHLLRRRPTPISPSHGLPPPQPPPEPAHSGVTPALDPPRSSFARIECDETLLASAPFELIVGLSAGPVAGVVGPALIRPPSSVGDYELTAHVVADGFELATAETWRKTMLVSAVDPYPHVVFHLIAPADTAVDHPLAINVLYSVDSQTMGLGVRCVRVVDRAADMSTEPVLRAPLPATVGTLGGTGCRPARGPDRAHPEGQ